MPTVLIVDDHPSFRASAQAILEAEGFEVVGEAEDGASAIEAAGRLHPDVVLLDVQLLGIFLAWLVTKALSAQGVSFEIPSRLLAYFVLVAVSPGSSRRSCPPGTPRG